MKKVTMLCLFIFIAGLLSTGCGSADKQVNEKEKVFRYGTMAYGPAMENAGTNPHDTYYGWSTVRYGIGETLFKFNNQMEIKPWLADSYKQIDDYTVQINLRNDITFSNGKKVTGDAVKACLEDLIAKNDRAPGDLKIKTIKAAGQSVTITSKEKVPALLNYLADPYGAIIDMEAGEKDRIVVGTGPYVAEKVTDTEIDLVKNTNYWGEVPKLDRIVVKSITDGDTLTMALQNGEIDAAQGLPYASSDLFKDENKYKISSANTSRVYQAAFNYKTKALKDLRVRQAISMAIDKDGFTRVLLHGNGVPAVGPFPGNMHFGGDVVKGQPYDIEEAKKLLQEAGYIDTDGDGYVEKDGKPLELRWLTYTSRQELPLLAESAQDSLKKIGVKLIVNATDNYKSFLKREEYDIYAKAFVTAPTGDPEYYFTTHVLDHSAYNHGFYHNDNMEVMAEELRNTFDKDKRTELAIRMQQQLLDDCAFIYAAHLKMSFVMKKNVRGFEAHPSDYYEITAALDI